MSDDILKRLYNECDPFLSATAKYYTDLSAVRGGETFIKTYCEKLNRSNGKVKVLFSGHSGCGKSSELKKLQYELTTETPRHDHSRYFPVYIDASDYVDYFDASLIDVLLSIVTEMAAQFREREGIELKNTALASLLSSVVEIARGSKPTKATIDLKLVKLELALNRADPNIREKVRTSLEPRTTGLLDEINNLFTEARTKLREKTRPDGTRSYTDFVLILDNLEKIQRIAGKDQGENSYRALFIQGAPQFTRLDCHTIFTVHLSLARAAGNELMQLYGNEPSVLSNVKVEERSSHAPWEPGRKALSELLSERCSPFEIKQCFKQDALDFLLRYSAGHVRQFLRFVRESTLHTEEAPISLKAAQAAVYKSVPSYSVGVSPEKWKMLAELEISDNQGWDTENGEKLNLMENLFVLEYINGDSAQSGFQKAKPWYSVHPIARELDDFTDAVKAAKKAIDSKTKPE